MPPVTRESVGVKNRRITLETPTGTSTTGEGAVPWPVQATIWAEMDGLTGTSRSGLMAEVEYRFRIWYRSDIRPQWRIGLTGSSRKFGIISVVDPDGRFQEQVILAKELI